MDEFWNRVAIGGPNECWLWLEHLSEDGYGLIDNDYAKRAHREAYFLTYGPTDLHVLHTCDNPPCCNPAHLYAGTQLQNMKDKVVRGRAARDLANGNAKLSHEDKIDLKSLHATGRYTYRQLGRIFGVDETRASQLIRGL